MSERPHYSPSNDQWPALRHVSAKVACFCRVGESKLSFPLWTDRKRTSVCRCSRLWGIQPRQRLRAASCSQDHPTGQGSELNCTEQTAWRSLLRVYASLKTAERNYLSPPTPLWGLSDVEDFHQTCSRQGPFLYFNVLPTAHLRHDEPRQGRRRRIETLKSPWEQSMKDYWNCNAMMNRDK